jgi:dGTPase
VKYTPFFRRLKNVTQVARAGEAYLYHDRLTHTLKVAQVGKRLAQLLLRREADRRIEDAQNSALDIGPISLPEENPERSLALAQELASKLVDDEIARQLNPEVVEVACLAHDLEHPPFGHIAEDELDRLLVEHTNPAVNDNLERTFDWRLDTLSEPDSKDDGWTVDKIDAWMRAFDEEPPGLRFEGNAQSFRILTRLANHTGSNTGLGLTAASLAAVQKYPYGRGEWIEGDYGEYYEQDKEKAAPGVRDSRSEGKFGFYKSERAAFEEIRDTLDLDAAPTLSADIMNYADDATYAVHDLVDFYKYDQIPLHRLLRQSHPGFSYDEPIERETVIEEIEPLSNGPSVEETLRFLASEAQTISISLFRPYKGTKEQQQALQAALSS